MEQDLTNVPFGADLELKNRSSNLRMQLDSLETVLDSVLPSGDGRKKIQEKIDQIWDLANEVFRKDYENE